jgi:DNA-binding response OmpR family regulator
MLRERLKSEGYNVEAAFDGLEGIEKAKKIKPDLILLDVMMPQLDGYSMAQRLKEDDLTTGIPIIVVTIKETMKELFQKLGINNFFTKPFDTDKLLGVIRTILADNQ